MTRSVTPQPPSTLEPDRLLSAVLASTMLLYPDSCTPFHQHHVAELHRLDVANDFCSYRTGTTPFIGGVTSGMDESAMRCSKPLQHTHNALRAQLVGTSSIRVLASVVLHNQLHHETVSLDQVHGGLLHLESGLAKSAVQPASRSQSSNEAELIHAGLVEVEKRIDTRTQQFRPETRYRRQQRRILIALHHVLLQEHHDFPVAFQYPSFSASPKVLATKSAMPARMRCHGIHAFLEILRHHLPDPMEHMLTFIYLSYPMMAFPRESARSVRETKAEYYDNLFPYRTAIENSDPDDDETLSSTTRMWYNEIVSIPARSGHMQHHLVVLAGSIFIEQPFYRTKVLTSISLCLIPDSTTLPAPLPSFQTSEPKWRAQYTTAHGALLPDRQKPSVEWSSFDKGIVYTTMPKPPKGDSALQMSSRFSRHDFATSVHRPIFVRLLSRLSSRYGAFHCAVSAVFLSHHLVAAASVTSSVGKGNHAIDMAPEVGSTASDPTLIARILSFLIMVAATTIIAIFGPKLLSTLDRDSSKDISIPIIISLISAIASGLCNDPAMPIYFMYSLAGISLGASLWIALVTATRSNSAIIHFVRYTIPCVVFNMALRAATLTGGSSTTVSAFHSIAAAGSDDIAYAFWSAASPLLSVLGSVGLNALINEKLKDLARFVIWVLLQFGFERR